MVFGFFPHLVVVLKFVDVYWTVWVVWISQGGAQVDAVLGLKIQGKSQLKWLYALQVVKNAI